MLTILVCTKFIQGELNPFDAAALECALELAESAEGLKRGTQVVVLGMGPTAWVEPMRRVTRLARNGNLCAILLSDPDFAGSDTLATSRILSAAIRKIAVKTPVGWVFCGRQSIDGDTAQVGPELAALLGFGLVTNCMELPRIFDETVQIPTRLGKPQFRPPF